MQQRQLQMTPTNTTGRYPEFINTVGRRKWMNIFRRHEADGTYMQSSGKYQDEDDDDILAKSSSTRTIGELSNATSVTSAASSYHSSYSGHSEHEASADEPIAPASRRPSSEVSMSNFYLDTDDEDSFCNALASNEEQLSVSSLTWMPEPPRNVDVSKYEYGDASPDHTEGEDGSSNSHHSRSSVDSIPQVPARPRRSSIHFGQEDTSETSRKSRPGHEFVGPLEVEHLAAATNPPKAPKRRSSAVRGRNHRASMPFGSELERGLPPFEPPSSAAPPIINNNNGIDKSSPNGQAKSAQGRIPRSSSMKQTGTRRRASIQFVGEIEITLRGHSNPVRRRTSITFASEQEVKEVTPSCDLTNEPERLWYRRSELKEIRIKNLSLIQGMESGEPRKKCLRGLEDMMESSKEREVRQRQAVDGVLTMQHLQRNTGDYDDEYLSRLYQFSSKSSGAIAAERGAQDAQAVTAYLAPTRIQERRRLSMF